MIVLFTDFGLTGPYTGQMKAVLAEHAPAVPVIDLFADAPAFQPYLSAYLLGAYCGAVPQGGVLLGVVDPGWARTGCRWSYAPTAAGLSDPTTACSNW